VAKRKLIDYGGFTAGKKARFKKTHDTSNVLGMRCQSCSKLNYISAVETRRAAVPRCNACGGTLNECETSYKRRNGVTFTGAARAAKTQSIKPFRCTTCKAEFRTTVALRMHVQERHPDSKQDVSDAGLQHGLNRRGQTAIKKLCQDIRHEEETGET